MSLPQWVATKKGCYGSWELMDKTDKTDKTGVYAAVDGHGERKPACYRIDDGEALLCQAGVRAAMRICEEAWGLIGVDEGKIGRRIVGRQPRQGAA